jgi:hypothetical protein
VALGTLLSFSGVIVCVGRRGFVGYLHHLSGIKNGEFGPTAANVFIAVLSAIVEVILINHRLVGVPVG